MAEAIHSLAEAQLRAKMTMGVRVIAQQRAIKAVKHQLQAQGRKVSDFAHREIVLAAKDYLVEHPELIAEVRPIVLRMLAEGVLGKRVARSVQYLRIAHKPSATAAQGFRLCEYHVRKGGL